MINPTISIIIVVYNDKEGLTETLESVKSLRYENREVIVVDGMSTDGTKDVIIENSLHISKWISEKDNGIYDAMNKGRDLATGDYLWYVNAGDKIYSPYTLEDILKGNDKTYDIYYGETLITDEGGEPKGLRRKRLPKQLKWQHFRNGMVVCHQSIIIKKSITEHYDTKYKYSADFKWVLQSLKKAESIQHCGVIMSLFKEGGATTKHRKESLKERYEIMKEYFGTINTIISHIKFIFDIFKPKYRKLGKYEDNIAAADQKIN